MKSAVPIEARLQWLRRFRDAIARHHVDLAQLAQQEIGKSEFDAMTADIMPLIASCNWHLRNARSLLRPRRVGGGGLFGLGHRVDRHRMAIGRVLIIATWNYPVQLVGIQLVQAVMAGNAVVVKPSERAPRTQGLLMRLAIEAAQALEPLGVAIEVRSASREEGRRVLAEEKFDHVVFTGSTEVGRAIAEVCAQRLIASTLELTGCDSAIVLGDADARAAARAVFMGFTANAGQTCMAPRRALVMREAIAAFTDELRRLLAGAPSATLVDEAAAAHSHDVAQRAIAAGGRSIMGTLEPRAGRVLRPVVVLDCPLESELFYGKHFGPVLAVRAVESIDEAFELHGRIGKYLATSIWTKRPSEELAMRAQACASSLVHFNAVILPSAHPAVSISGHGASGWGCTRGEAGLLALTREVCVTRTSRFIEVPVKEPSSRVQRSVSRFICWSPHASPSSHAAPGPQADASHNDMSLQPTKAHL